jgi:DNA-binding CsgD family transcriptional regulator
VGRLDLADPVRDEDIDDDEPARLTRKHGTEHLTVREIECLQLAARGFTNMELAGKLGISYETARHHMKKAYYKLDAADRSHAVAIAFRAGVIS